VGYRDGEAEDTAVGQGPFPWAIPGPVRNVVTSIIVGAMIAGLVWYFDGQGSPVTSQSLTLTAAASGPAPRVGKPAPDFRLVGLDGQPVQLSELRGHPVWLSFWATWCPPCRAENPDIQAVYQANKENGLVVLAVNIGEETSTVRGYADRTGLTFSIVLDQATEVAAMYRIVGIPTHYFIDAEGVVRDWRIGSMSRTTMDRKVRSILSNPASQAEGR
jgi:peroxiredoxin